MAHLQFIDGHSIGAVRVANKFYSLVYPPPPAHLTNYYHCDLCTQQTNTMNGCARGSLKVSGGGAAIGAWDAKSISFRSHSSPLSFNHICLTNDKRLTTAPLQNPTPQFYYQHDSRRCGLLRMSDKMSLHRLGAHMLLIEHVYWQCVMYCVQHIRMGFMFFCRSTCTVRKVY